MLSLKILNFCAIFMRAATAEFLRTINFNHGGLEQSNYSNTTATTTTTKLKQQNRIYDNNNNSRAAEPTVTALLKNTFFFLPTYTSPSDKVGFLIRHKKSVPVHTSWVKVPVSPTLDWGETVVRYL